MPQSKKELDEITAIQLIALKNLERPDLESHFRKLARWFSKTYHTSYFDIIEKMTFEELLLHRFEYTLENVGAEEVGRIRRQLLHQEEVAVEEAEDEDWVQKEIDSIKAEEKKLAEKKQSALKLNKQEVAELVENFPEISMKF